MISLLGRNCQLTIGECSGENLRFRKFLVNNKWNQIQIKNQEFREDFQGCFSREFIWPETSSILDTSENNLLLFRNIYLFCKYNGKPDFEMCFIERGLLLYQRIS